MIPPKTFKAWLTGNHLEWVGDAPERGEQPLPIQVTVLDEPPTTSTTRGQRMAEILAKLASTQAIDNSDPVVWQQTLRRDRTLPGR